MALPATEAYSGASANLGDPPWTLMRAGAFHIKTDGSGNGTVETANQDCLEFWNADIFGNDQYSKYVAKFTGVGTGSGYLYLIARASGNYATGTWYWAWSDGGSDTKLYKDVGGSFTLLGSADATTFTSGDEFKLECNGSAITFYKNSSSIITQTDSAIASGSAGMGGWGGVGTVLFDTWEGGNVSAGGNTIAVPAGALTLSGFAPTIVQTANNQIAVPAGSLTLAALAPTVIATANNAISVPAGSLSLTAFAPIVTVAGGPQVIDVPLGILTLTGYAPAVSTGTEVTYGPLGPMSATIGFYDNRKKVPKKKEPEPEVIEELPETPPIVPLKVPMFQYMDMSREAAIAKQALQRLDEIEEDEETEAIAYVLLWDFMNADN